MYICNGYVFCICGGYVYICNGYMYFVYVVGTCIYVMDICNLYIVDICSGYM